MKITRILGREGRTTIPYDIRKKLKIARGAILSFEDRKDGSILIRQGKPCTNCTGKKNSFRESSLLELLNELSVSEKKAILKYLLKTVTDEVVDEVCD